MRAEEGEPGNEASETITLVCERAVKSFCVCVCVCVCVCEVCKSVTIRSS